MTHILIINNIHLLAQLNHMSFHKYGEMFKQAQQSDKDKKKKRRPSLHISLASSVLKNVHFYIVNNLFKFI